MAGNYELHHENSIWPLCGASFLCIPFLSWAEDAHLLFFSTVKSAVLFPPKKITEEVAEQSSLHLNMVQEKERSRAAGAAHNLVREVQRRP